MTDYFKIAELCLANLTADELVRFEGVVENTSANFEWPRLIEVRKQDDDGEYQSTLECPVCGVEVTEDTLAAVDRAERWTYVCGFDHPGDRALFHFDDLGEFSDTLYYMHNDDHRVLLPTGWVEA